MRYCNILNLEDYNNNQNCILIKSSCTCRTVHAILFGFLLNNVSTTNVVERDIVCLNCGIVRCFEFETLRLGNTQGYFGFKFVLNC